MRSKKSGQIEAVYLRSGSHGWVHSKAHGGWGAVLPGVELPTLLSTPAEIGDRSVAVGSKEWTEVVSVLPRQVGVKKYQRAYVRAVDNEVQIEYRTDGRVEHRFAFSNYGPVHVLVSPNLYYGKEEIEYETEYLYGRNWLFRVRTGQLLQTEPFDAVAATSNNSYLLFANAGAPRSFDGARFTPFEPDPPSSLASWDRERLVFTNASDFHAWVYERATSTWQSYSYKSCD